MRGAARKEQAGDGTQDLQLPLKLEAQVDVPADIPHTSDGLSRLCEARPKAAQFSEAGNCEFSNSGVSS